MSEERAPPLAPRFGRVHIQLGWSSVTSNPRPCRIHGVVRRAAFQLTYESMVHTGHPIIPRMVSQLHRCATHDDCPGGGLTVSTAPKGSEGGQGGGINYTVRSICCHKTLYYTVYSMYICVAAYNQVQNACACYFVSDNTRMFVLRAHKCPCTFTKNDVNQINDCFFSNT